MAQGLCDPDKRCPSPTRRSPKWQSWSISTGWSRKKRRPRGWMQTRTSGKPGSSRRSDPTDAYPSGSEPGGLLPVRRFRVSPDTRGLRPVDSPDTVISCRNVWKIFGPNPKQFLAQVERQPRPDRPCGRRAMSRRCAMSVWIFSAAKCWWSWGCRARANPLWCAVCRA